MIINLNTATGTQYLWRQERIILQGIGQGFAPLYLWTNLHGSQAAPLARYEQANFVTLADITDYVRAYPSVTKIYYTDDLSPDETPNELSVSVSGLINPANDIIPFNCEALIPYAGTGQGVPDMTGILIAPPSMILAAVDDEDLYAEIRLKPGTNVQKYSVFEAGTSLDMQSDTLEIYANADEFGIWDNDEQAKGMQYKITPLNPERNYLLLSWVSRYGGIKCFSWEFRNVKYATNEKIEIEQINNEYDVRKGLEMTLTARLDGLSSYDYWYYADIINSSNVRAYYGGIWRKVTIETKDATMPNASSGEFKTLEITVKFAKYDAI